MPETIDAVQLRQHLDDVLARAADGEYIVVRSVDGREVAIGPRQRPGDTRRVRARPRHRSERSVAEVLAEDRGA